MTRDPVTSRDLSASRPSAPGRVGHLAGMAPTGIRSRRLVMGRVARPELAWHLVARLKPPRHRPGTTGRSPTSRCWHWTVDRLPALPSRGLDLADSVDSHGMSVTGRSVSVAVETVGLTTWRGGRGAGRHTGRPR